MVEPPATPGEPSPPHRRPSTSRVVIERADRRAIGSALPPRQNSTNDGSNDSAPRGCRTFSFAAEHAASGTPPGTTAAEPRTPMAPASKRAAITAYSAVLSAYPVPNLGVLAYDGAVIQSGVTVARSEEHTSELQSLMRISYAVLCWTKKTNIKIKHI